MDFRFTKEEEAFREEVSQWLKKEIPQEWYDIDIRMWEENDESWAIARAFQLKLGQKGWLAPGLPKEYGGGGLGIMKRLILAEELATLDAPVGIETIMSVEWVSPTLLLFGTEEQKRKYVLPVAKGDIVFCLGYSEPNAGSDLASVQTRATEVSDGFVLNGQKIWTTIAHYADYMWIAARTDPDAPKHRGISMFVIDMKTPGITVRPLINLLNCHSFNEVFFDEAHISKDCLVGEKNRGWYHLASAALEFEHGGGLSGGIGATQTVKELVQYCKETKRYGKPIAEDPLIRQELAQSAIEASISRKMCYRIASKYARGLHPGSEGSMSMLVGTQLSKRMMNLGMRITGLYGLLEKDSKWAVLKGGIERMYLATASSGVGGGTTEIQRNIVAQRGLGLPRG